MGCSNSQDRIVIPYRPTSLVMESYMKSQLGFGSQLGCSNSGYRLEFHSGALFTWVAIEYAYDKLLQYLILSQVLLHDIIIPMSEIRHFIFLLEFWLPH